MTTRPITLWIIVIWIAAELIAWAAAYPSLDLARASCQWDCVWYTNLVAHGYDHQPNIDVGRWQGQANWAFFPLFPLVTRAIGALLRTPPVWSAFLLNVVTFVAVIRVAIMDLRLRGHAADWRYVAAFWAFYPLNIWYGAQYTECLYALMLLGAITSLRSGHIGLSALCAALLTASRPTGFFMVICLALWWFMRPMAERSRGTRFQDAAILISVSGAALSAYVLYLAHLTGDGFAFVHVEYAWGRSFHPFWEQIYTGLTTTSLRPLALATIAAMMLVAYMLLKRWYLEALLLSTTIVLATSTSVVSIERYALGNPVVIAFVAAYCARLTPTPRWLLLLAFITARIVILREWYNGFVFLI